MLNSVTEFTRQTLASHISKLCQINSGSLEATDILISDLNI